MFSIKIFFFTNMTLINKEIQHLGNEVILISHNPLQL